ncbi:pseudouridine synthase [Halopseudomonas pelagia]|uniref:pseudouridine synthase n=1 Tax=Halopseudomonas pelagia TaxID=553151 RepID=UPI0003A1B6F3|nr:pseudouridine synthase [Halopseudomonas pelagia]|tara:strand:- start:858 stop:1553 length:696 start_codon:yes stop_codon:yes gene_type:complete
MRLDRLIGNHSQYSQRSARLLIAEGRVQVNALLVRDARMEVDRFMMVSVDGVPLKPAVASHYLMLHKPAGYLSATSDPQHITVMALLPEPLRAALHIGGRLDRGSSGLLILTNDGLWSRRLTAPQIKIPKVYRVTTAEPISAETPERFAQGIYFAFEDLTTSPAQLERLGTHEARLTIFEGRYHQVKRMFHALGNRVLTLHRESMGDIVLDDRLQAGDFRPLSQTEIDSIG